MRSPSRLPGLNVPVSPTPPGPWPPPPPRGAGAVVAIPEEGRIRERKPTRQLPLQALPIPWTVGGILPWGEVSPLGEGTFAPSPVYFQYDGKGREEGQTPLRISEF